MISHQLPAAGFVPGATKVSVASTPHAGAKCSLTWRWSAATAACTSAGAVSLLSLMIEIRIVAMLPPGRRALQYTPGRANRFRSRSSIHNFHFPIISISLTSFAESRRRAFADLRLHSRRNPIHRGNSLGAEFAHRARGGHTGRRISVEGSRMMHRVPPRRIEVRHQFGAPPERADRKTVADNLAHHGQVRRDAGSRLRVAGAAKPQPRPGSPGCPGPLSRSARGRPAS